MNEQAIQKKSLMEKFMGGIEKVGNSLPHPFYLFTILIVVAIILSVIFSGVTVEYNSAAKDGSGMTLTEISVLNLLNANTINYVMKNIASIHFSFSPLVSMSFLMLAIGLAEDVGLFQAFIKKTIGKANTTTVFAIVAFIAINSNTASTAGTIGVTAVSAAVFASMGLNPWLGIIMAYAASNAGYSANVFMGNMDVLISGITASVASGLGWDCSDLHVLFHWFFMGASAIVLTFVYTFVTTKFVRGYIGEPKDLSRIGVDTSQGTELTDVERKGLRAAGIALVVFVAIWVAMCVPSNSFLRAADGSLLPNSPLLSNVLFILFTFFMTTGIAYGRATGVIDDWNKLPKLLQKALSTMLNFMVISLPASVFIYLFNASNIPTIIGVKAAQIITSFNVSPLIILIAVVFLSTFFNLFMTTGSAKWMILAPMFIPMLLEIGITPAGAAVAYRIGDSATNAVAPISTDVALIIGMLEKYNTDPDKRPGMGTVFGNCMPYAIATLITEITLLAIWYIFKIPLGPGTSLFV